MQRWATAGRREKHDVLVEVGESRGGGVTVAFESPVRELFRADQDRAVRDVLTELRVHDARVTVLDEQALDFVIRARVQAAVLRLRREGGAI